MTDEAKPRKTAAKKSAKAVVPKPFGSEPDKVEKHMVGLRPADLPFPESLPSGAVLPVGETPVVVESSIPEKSLAETQTPEVWFAHRSKFVEAASPYEVVYAFCTDFGIKKVPVAADLNKFDPMSRPFEICKYLFDHKE